MQVLWCWIQPCPFSKNVLPRNWLCAKSDDFFSISLLWQPSVFGTCVPPMGHTQWRMLRSQNQQYVFRDFLLLRYVKCIVPPALLTCQHQDHLIAWLLPSYGLAATTLYGPLALKISLEAGLASLPYVFGISDWSYYLGSGRISHTHLPAECIDLWLLQEKPGRSTEKSITFGSSCICYIQYDLAFISAPTICFLS